MLDSREDVAVADPPGEPTAPADRFRYAALLVPVAVMAALGFWGLGRHDAMGNDEVATRWISSLNLHAMAHVLNRLDAVHGLYYLFIHVWQVVGDSPTAIRVPSVLAMTAAVGVVGVIGVRLTGSILVGTVAGLIAALTPSISFYAQTARSYALVYLVVALTTLVLLRAMEADSVRSDAWVAARRWVGYGLLVVLGGYLNELSLLVLGAHLVTVVLTRPGRRVMLSWLATAVPAVLVVLPLVVISRRESNVLDYLARPDVDDLRVLFHSYFGATTGIGIAVAVVALVGLALNRVNRVNRDGAPDGPQAGRPTLSAVAAPLAIVPAGLLLIYSEIFRPLYVDRYVLFGEIGVALLAGAGLGQLGAVLARGSAARGLGSRPPWTAAVAALVACSCVFAFQLDAQERAHLPASRQFNFGGPARLVGAGARPGDGVLFFDSFYRKARLGYPQDFRDTDDFAMAVSPARLGTFRGTNKPLAVIRPLMLARTRIWVVGLAPGRTGRSGLSIQEQAQVLERNFIRVSRHQFGRIDVTLWRRA